MHDGYTVATVQSLRPLPDEVRHGLYALAFFGSLSTIAAGSLLTFITIRLIRWRTQGEIFTKNQIIILIYNLLVADIQQGLAFAFSASWIHRNAIEVGTAECWMQGWLLSTGDVAGALFTLAIAAHTFVALVFDYKLKPKPFISVIVGIWTLVLVLAAIPHILHHKSPVYKRAGEWCWINPMYPKLRLATHYVWLFLSMFGSVVIYGSLGIFLTYRARLTRKTFSSLHATSSAAAIQRAARYTMIFPVVYIVCTLPLAIARMAAWSGVTVSTRYYLIAGCFFGSCGWIDTITYALTRRKLLIRPRRATGSGSQYATDISNRDHTSTAIAGSTNPSLESDKYHKHRIGSLTQEEITEYEMYRSSNAEGITIPEEEDGISDRQDDGPVQYPASIPSSRTRVHDGSDGGAGETPFEHEEKSHDLESR